MCDLFNFVYTLFQNMERHLSWTVNHVIVTTATSSAQTRRVLVRTPLLELSCNLKGFLPHSSEMIISYGRHKYTVHFLMKSVCDKRRSGFQNSAWSQLGLRLFLSSCSLNTIVSSSTELYAI